MTNYSLMETRSIKLENEVDINLKYYLINETRYEGNNECFEGACVLKDERLVNVYGVKLVKEVANTELAIEEDEIIGITDSEATAKILIKTLADNAITPMVLCEVVDDWATETLFA